MAQIPGTLVNVETALAAESRSLDDVVRIKAFYSSDGSVDEWQVMAALAKVFTTRPLPAISLLPVTSQPFSGQSIQIQAIAQWGWRRFDDVRVVECAIPTQHKTLFTHETLTAGLRAGEFIAIANRTAVSLDERITGDGAAQSKAIMDSLSDTLSELGASFQDVVKKECYYFGTDRPQWAAMATVRASYFKEPGPVATTVPCQVLWPDEAVTKIELLAMRTSRDGFDKYIPREDSWPPRVWDWPIPLPYRQGSRLRDVIWLGGKYPHRRSLINPVEFIPLS